jgi:translation initiation factor 3 subunit J
MAGDDSWEDWEEAADVPQLPKLSGTPAPAAAAAQDKFAGEDEGEEEPEHDVPKPQEPKKATKPKYEDKGAVPDDTPLDDPVAEKLRKQRLIEDADLRNAQELFGIGGGLEKQKLKTMKEHDTYGKAVAAQFLRQHEGSAHYKALLKGLLKTALENVPAQETKDIETALAGLRADKVKAEAAAAAAAKKAGKKKSVNVGSKGGTAGLDDYIYDDAGDGDEYDFM